MSDPQHAIDAIDHALDDDTSDDAMRWTPDVDPEPVGLAGLIRAFHQSRARMQRLWCDTVLAFSRQQHALRAQQDPRHRIRCAVCSLFANPRPLPRGAAYRRRQLARRRRRRQ